MNDVEWVKNMLRSGRVTRYHNTPMLTRQTVADHTWGVCVCLQWLFDGEVSADLLKAALYHDAPEIITGDLPAPAKVDNQHLVDALVVIEEQFKDSMDLHVALNNFERSMLSIADSMELLLHCAKEMHMGNGYGKEILKKGYSYFQKKYNEIPSAEMNVTIRNKLFHFEAHIRGLM